MSEFDKREKSFEKKFAHDEEIQFKVRAQANRMLGLWAAYKLGKTGAEAEAYAKGLVEKDIADQLEGGAAGQIHRDFVAAGVAQSEHQIARHFEEFRAQADKDAKA